MEEEKGVVKVSDKSIYAYVRACNYCLSNFGFAKVRGLGKTSDKVLEIKSIYEDVVDVEISEMSSIEVNNISGMELILRKKGEEDSK